MQIIANTVPSPVKPEFSAEIIEAAAASAYEFHSPGSNFARLDEASKPLWRLIAQGALRGAKKFLQQEAEGDGAFKPMTVPKSQFNGRVAGDRWAR